MPLQVRRIQPTNLSSQPLLSQSDDSQPIRTAASVDNPLECVTNRTLCQAMRQLASLLHHADTMFSELEDNCVDITKRSERIAKRVLEIQYSVEKFNPKKEKIREYKLQHFYSDNVI